MVKGVEKDQSSHKVCFRIALRGLNQKSMYALQLSVPSGMGGGGNDMTLRTTEFQLNPGKKGFEWEPFMVMSNKIPDEKTALKFELIERKDEKNNFVGEAEVSFGNVIDQTGKTIKIMKSGYVLGTFKVMECKKVIKHSFLNYVYAGTEISLIMAIDFTNSNGESPNDENCLHFVNKDGDNLYMQAIKNIGGILQYYDTDSLIPIYGFGAKLPPYYNVVSHCFALNSNYFNPEVEGLAEVLNTYKKAVKALRFHGPTAFSEVINLAVRFAESTPIDDENQKYYLLLIITDGDISDFEATKDQLVRASELPISVIIVGVGEDETEFKKMEELDGDEFPVFSKLYNKEWDRDIVQFVRLADFKKDGVYNIEELALSTLEEIPKQFLEFMQSHNLEPIKNVAKSARTTGQDYLFQKLEDKKRNRKSERKGPPTFLVNQRNEFYQKLVALEFDPELIMQILDEGIPAADINLFMEYVSLTKTADLFPADINNMMPTLEGQITSVRNHTPKKKNFVKVTNFTVGQKRELEHIKSRVKAENYKLTQQILESKDKGEIDYKIKTVGPKFVASKKLKEDDDEDNIEKIHHDYVPLEQRDVNEHYKDLTKNTAQVSTDQEFCMKCRINLIDIIFRPCGHAAICKYCKPKPPVCPICKQNIASFAKSDAFTTKT